ncbi:MAG: alpha/beta fold hydrolase [Acidimicrobiales bacterium]
MEHDVGEGTVLHYEDEGSGPPVVLLHGVMMSGRFFERQLGGGLAGHRVIVPDFRGHGRSSKVLSGHTVANYARDLSRLLQDRGVERPVLVGWSMGAMVVYEYLKTYGAQSVRGIVIVDQPPSDFAWEDYAFGVLTPQALAEMIEGLQLDQAAVAAEFAQLMQHEPSEDVTAWMVDEILRVPAAVASTILADQTLQDYRPLLPTIDCPTLVMFGRDPKLTPPEAGAWIAERIPGARLEVFESSSHCPFHEEAERFNAVLGAWVDDLVRSSVEPPPTE